MRAYFCVLVVAAAGVLSGCTGASNAVPPSWTPLARAASASPRPLIFAGATVNGQPGITEFARNANGNVMPVRAMAFGDILLSLFGADSSNNLWALFRQRHTYDPGTFYAVHFSPAFKVLGRMNLDSASIVVDSKGNVYSIVDTNTIVEYAAGTYGKKVLRSINLTRCCLESTPLLAVDGSRNLYASAYPSATNESQLEIAVWGRKGSGSVPPKRTIATGSAAPSQMLADRAGDVYAAFGDPYTFADGIWTWPIGNPTPQWLLAGLPLKAFALDSAGNIYAEVPTIENNFAIEVFSPQGQAIAAIAGAKTRLGYPTAITVTP